MNIAAEIAKCREVVAVQMLVFDKLSKLCDDNIGEHTKSGITSDACICGTGDIKDANSICNILTCPIDLSFIYSISARGGSMDPNKAFKRKRGRPKGWKMPQAVRCKIAGSKMNDEHSIKTRNKISESLRKHFRGQEKVSVEMLRMYKQDKIRTWIRENAGKLDGGIVRTEQFIININKTEIQVGDTINFYGHGCTALTILLSFEMSQFVAVREYRQCHRSRKKSGKDYCNSII